MIFCLYVSTLEVAHFLLNALITHLINIWEHVSFGFFHIWFMLSLVFLWILGINVAINVLNFYVNQTFISPSCVWLVKVRLFEICRSHIFLRHLFTVAALRYIQPVLFSPVSPPFRLNYWGSHFFRIILPWFLAWKHSYLVKPILEFNLFDLFFWLSLSFDWLLLPFLFDIDGQSIFQVLWLGDLTRNHILPNTSVCVAVFKLLVFRVWSFIKI